MATCKNGTIQFRLLSLRHARKEEELKIVVLGGEGVGKSTLISQFLDGEFLEKYKGTFETIYTRQFKDRGVRISLEIVDITRGDSVPSLRQMAIEDGEAFILMYSVVDKDSFEELYKFRDLILELKGEQKLPIFIIANKVDMNAERKTPIWQVADAVATIDLEHMYMEVSAVDKEQVDRLFRQLIRQACIVYKDKFKQPSRRMTLPTTLLTSIKRKVSAK
ncbi:ras-related protein Rap-2a-like [Haliotis rubra]|uniref:ras-related protein Rap-2a-like n=1 Tax=Haliotis rubra TaxID=36100 RepID=UPI001EE5AFD6|nr:ras-related protein Rap-2a-like [Haliotis rubra]